jgi:hypothetical protein
MAKNVTLRLDEAVFRKARHLAVENHQSLSQWLSDLISHAVATSVSFAEARKRALRRLASPLKLGGKPLTREQAHER